MKAHITDCTCRNPGAIPGWFATGLPSAHQNYKKKNLTPFRPTIKKANQIDVTVQTVLPNDAEGVIYTQRGIGEVAAHEARRQQVFKLAYDAYIAPVESNGYRAMRCGTICRKTPGEAKTLLVNYLNSLQQLGINQFSSWVDPLQQAISGESNQWKIDPTTGLRDYIINPVSIPTPPDLPDSVQCPNFN